MKKNVLKYSSPGAQQEDESSLMNRYNRTRKSTGTFSLEVSCGGDASNALVLASDGFRLIHICLGLSNDKAQLRHAVVCHRGNN